MENKTRFLSTLETALIMYSREKVVSIKLSEDGDEVVIRFANGAEKTVSVAFDSCAAMMIDIGRALVY